MPNPLTPEQRRAYRARCIAEHRCANCARLRPPDDRETLCCRSCRETKNRGSARRYAQYRKDNPPEFACLNRADPSQSFRYGRTRLDRPRRITVQLDQDTLELIDACRRNYISTPDYQPYQVSEIIRRLLSVLQDQTYRIPYRGPLPRGYSTGLSLCFMCDHANYQVIQTQHSIVGGPFAGAVRDCIHFAANRVLTTLPDREARRLLWPTDQSVTPDVSACPSAGTNGQVDVSPQACRISAAAGQGE